MPGRLLLVRPGAGSEAALVSALARARRGDRLAPVTVAVATPIVALDLRRRLAAAGPLAGVRFVPFNRLVEMLGAPAAAGATDRRPLSGPALGAAVRAAVAAAPGRFSGVADHPSTEEALVRAYRLLRPLTDEDRARLGASSKRAADVVRLVAATRDRLEKGWYDRHDLLVAATEAVAAGLDDLDDLGGVVCYLPGPLSPAELGLFEALARQVDVEVLAGAVGDAAADRASAATLAALGAAGWSLEDTTAGAEDAGPRVDEVVGAPDAEQEVATAVRLLVRHAESGGHLGRTAVAFPAGATEVYRPLLAHGLAAAGIGFAEPSAGSLAATPAGAVLLGLVSMASDPAAPLERAAVVRWLSSPALYPSCALFAGRSTLANAPRLPIGALDRCSREAGVIGGIGEWRARLGAYARRHADEEEPSPATVARDLLAVVERLHALSNGLRSAETWSGVATWAGEATGLVVADEEARSRVDDALAELSELDDLEPLVVGGGPARTARRAVQLVSAFASALSRPASRTARFGSGPLIGPVPGLAGLRSDLLVLIGAAEGLLPGRSREDLLSVEVDRGVVKALSERERVEERDRRCVTWLLAGAERSVVVYPRVGSGASRVAHRSRWLVGDLFDNEPHELASFPAALAAVAVGDLAAADSNDLELAVARRSLGAGGRVDRSLLGGIADLAERFADERERRTSTLSRFAGQVGPLPGDGEVFGDVMSATRLEDLAACPLRFMFQRLVRLEVLEAPERRNTISPLDRGSLVHEILERFVEQTALSVGSFQGWNGGHLGRLREIAEERFETYRSRGLTGKAVYWEMERSRILRDLERFVALEGERLAATGGRPIRTEMAFGDRSEPPVELSLGGTTVRFRGKIDRVDLEPDGVVRVIDYKTGSARSYAGLEDDPVDGGRHLQLPIYALAARRLAPGGREEGAVVAEFRFCSSAGRFKTIPARLDAALDARLHDVVGVLCETVAQGSFPPRPGNGHEYANCATCDFERCCRLDRGEAWERARGERSMEAYVELVEKRATR